MKIEKRDTAPQEATVFITVHADDYQKSLQDELTKQRQKADIKGFRKGKAPMSLIKRMVGGELLFRMVYDKAIEAFNTYIKENELSLIGQALPSEQQPEIEWDINQPRDYTFAFDIGLSPDIQLQGIEDQESITYYEVLPDRDKIEKDIERDLLTLGTWKESNAPITDGSKIQIEAVESKPAEGRTAWTTAFEIEVSEAAEGFKNLLTDQKQGAQLEAFNISEVLINSTPELMRTRLLNMDEEDKDIEVSEQFTGTIKKVYDKIPAVEDAEFYQKVFGEDTEVADRSGAIEWVAERKKAQFQSVADQLFIQEVLDSAHQQTEVVLPKPFLQKWIDASYEGEEQKPTLDQYEAMLSRSLVDEEIIRTYDTEITEQDVQEELVNALYAKYPMLRGNPQYLQYFMEPMLKDQNEIRAAQMNAQIKKSVLKAKETLQLNVEEIGEEAFTQLLAERNKAAAGPEEEE